MSSGNGKENPPADYQKTYYCAVQMFMLLIGVIRIFGGELIHPLSI